MKRTTKNVFLFAGMFVAVGMLTLTLLHGYGVIGGAGNGAAPSEGFPGGGPSGFEDFQRPNGNGENDGAFDGEEIGEVTLPDGANANNGNNGNNGAMTPPEMGGNKGAAMTPPQMPNDVNNVGNGNNLGNGRTGLGAHLAFATVWVFLFAFCLSWAILSRCNADKSEKRGGDGQWKSEPASNGTN